MVCLQTRPLGSHVVDHWLHARHKPTIDVIDPPPLLAYSVSSPSVLISVFALFIAVVYTFILSQSPSRFPRFDQRPHVARPSRSSVVDPGRMHRRVFPSSSCLPFSFCFSLNIALRISRPASLRLFSLFSVYHVSTLREASQPL